MRIILTTDIPKVGNRYDLKEVKDGYANVLIAKGVALLATPQAISSLEAKKAQIEKKKEEETKVFESIIATIDNRKIEIKAKANEKGHLFKAVSAHEIAQAIKLISGVEIEESAIIMDHIKELGLHTIEIKKGNRKGRCEVLVIKA
ncbi:MAG: 50S ribosomal protein L9 [Candidatus Nomurabacteria bacterium GW2011_GWF2_35_66]|uniref:Large ribosomal subunit protein bL9 n=1 Tax=Candidatus Nomurabacteria bacterium GW2011_GWE1_35_16 TaxID=1618761 RepID=A0A0G0B9Y5_9BACT|nr:MAG: 50S ribosomal protein L9 [Candidatus Nomurabacteria bacterium GW2011_GWF1_34_20]KKP62839.1 MAG: 50S ribosomal protein L9 [Candidatus Nomurabacteria bacterium GW2011_GWE2_34_25]KKP66238.1 MAG: 50S ribosomal protein L9 [Candidatus Nomurabacteria bacterium GW2011_GWE1_35_16]KKP83070.1 MAG: 50S ribosomal protein L9 [Candidatus Nomurabacteria bacterium GW2011_GWF2_35_66]HAE36665.1 50S ribosomal protein L9 [Candidatus Nomurabacteria bacterium]